MSTTQKQLGDRVLITAGPHKDKIGVLVAKERRGWIVELDDGEHVTVSFPFVAVVKSASEMESVTDSSRVVNEDEVQSSEASDQSPVSITFAGDTQSTAEGNDQKITKMSVKQLQAVAKQKGIGIARTKPDFLRIIQEKHPDEDLDQLKGKTLFHRIGELHISRLRSKQDLVSLLTASES